MVKKFLILVMLFPLLADASAGESPELDSIIQTYDKLKERKPRMDVPGAYRTRFGTQIDESCFPIARQKQKTAKDFEQWIEDAVFSMTTYCGRGIHPEFSPYIEEAVSQLRRAVIYCEAEDHPGYGAYCAPDPMHKTWSEQPVQINPKHYFKRAWYRYATLRKKYEAFYVFRPRLFLHVSSLIHEVFHFTGANSNDDHADVVKATLSSDQKESIIKSDRIYTLEDLCSPDAMNARNRIISKLLKPNLQFCVEVFTKQTTDKRDQRAFPSKPLSFTQALTVCRRLQDQKQCYMSNILGFNATSPQGAIRWVHQEINRILERYVQEVSQFLPQWEGHFPKKSRTFLNSHSLRKLEKTLKLARQQECFSKVIYENPSNGDLTISWQANKRFNFKQFSLYQMRRWFGSNRMNFDSFLASECSDPFSRAYILDLVDYSEQALLTGNIQSVLFSSVLANAAFTVSSYAEVGKLRNETSTLRKLLKNPLLKKFTSKHLQAKLQKLPALFDLWRKFEDMRTCPAAAHEAELMR